MGVILLFTTVPERDAAGISETLIRERVAACVNVIDVGLSVYFWEGKVVREAEKLLLIKTEESKAQQAVELLKRIHPYKVPEIITLRPQQVNEEYAKWVKDYTSGA